MTSPRAAADEPRSVGDLDKDLGKTIQGVHRVRWIMILIALVALAAGCITLGVIVFQQQRELDASCAWYAEVAVLPVTPAPPATRPGVIGVKLIAASRVAYYGQGCGGRLAPNPTLRQWASYYRVPYLP